MKAFVTSLVAMVMIAGIAAWSLEYVEWSSAEVYSTDNVRLD